MLEYYPGFVEAAIEYKIHSRKMIAESKSKKIKIYHSIFNIIFQINRTNLILHMRLHFIQKTYSIYKKILKQVMFIAARMVKRVRKNINFNN